MTQDAMVSEIDDFNDEEEETVEVHHGDPRLNEKGELTAEAQQAVIRKAIRKNALSEILGLLILHDVDLEELAQYIKDEAEKPDPYERHLARYLYKEKVEHKMEVARQTLEVKRAEAKKAGINTKRVKAK